MTYFDSDEYKEKERIKRERLAPLFARLDGPPGMISIGPGWYDLVLDLDAKLAEIDPDYTIAQVKEKFGGLRYYIESTVTFNGAYIESPFYKAVSAAEELSFKICEDCGAPGERRGGNWTITLCDACEAARDGDRRIA